MANELDELTGPINTAGNSNSKIMNFFGSNGIKEASTAFGTVGSAAIKKSQINVVVVAANNNEQITPQEMSINKPLVNMINALASIDGQFKQRLENFKIITANKRLARRESQVEQQGTAPQIEVIQPDAEKVSGSNVGLFALGGLALLALDPVQEALKTVFEGVASAGRFITGVASSINDAFRFILDSKVPAGAEPANTPDTKSPPPPANNTADAQAVPTPPAETPMVPAAQATSEEKPSFLGSMATGALGGAMVGSFIPKVGAVGGAIVGGAYGAYKYATGGSTSAPSSSSPSTSAPAATGGATTPPASTSPAPATTEGSAPAGNIISVNHPDTGPGFGIAGANDQQGRPIAFSKEGAEAFAKMMADSGGAVKPSDVAGSKRSLQKNAAVGGATNSPHLRGVAMDIHGSSGEWIRQHGHKYGWKPHDYSGTHGGHFVFGGAGMTPDEGSPSSGITGAIGEAATGGLKMVGELLGILGSAIIKPGIARTDLAGTISKAATEMNAEVATSKTPKEPKVPTPPTPPNINRAASGATQNPATASDKTIVYYYLRRFGFQDLNTPEKAIPRAVIA
jgi:hypothetical protein